MALACDDGLYLADLDGSQITRLSDVPSSSVDFSPDGSTLLVGTLSGPALLVDVSTGETTKRMLGHDNMVDRCCFSPDGDWMATAAKGDNNARLWRRDGTPVAVLRHLSGFILNAVFSADGTRLFTLGGDGALRSWCTSTDELMRLAATRGGAYSETDRARFAHLLEGPR